MFATRMKVLTAVAAAAVMSTGTATAQEKPLEHMLGMVDGLYAACTYEGPDQAEVEYHFGNCVGFIRGVRVTYEVQAMEHGEHFICPPADIQNVQLRDAVVAEIDTGKWPKDSYSPYPIVAALKKSWPCPT